MSQSEEPEYAYQVTPSHEYRTKVLATEEEAQSHLNALRDRDYAGYKNAEIERFQKVGRGTIYWRKRDGHWLNRAFIKPGLTTEEILALEEEYDKRPKPVGPQTFIGTFTRHNFHPNTGQNLRFARIALQAKTRDDANDLMWDAFGDGGWYDAHPVDEMDRETQETLFAPPYFKIPWPTPPVVGETVTLRVRITPEQAKESSLWLAGRCILNRAAANDIDVAFGAGVQTEVEDERDLFRMRGAPPIGGAGVVLRVKFVRREDAERAVAADTENVSIVEGSTSYGTFRTPPKVFKDEPMVSKNKISISGTFTANALSEIANCDPAFSAIHYQVEEELARLGVAGEKVIGIEVEENRIVAIHVEREWQY
jgi:hypothetical protein